MTKAIPYVPYVGTIVTRGGAAGVAAVRIASETCGVSARR